MSRSEWAFAIIALACGCAPAAGPPPKSKAEPVVARPEPAATPTLLSPGALPTAPTLAIVAEGASAMLHIDAARVRQSPLYVAYRETVRALGEDPLAATRAACGFDLLESAQFITWSGSAPGERGRDLAGAAALAFDRPASEVVACVQKTFDGVSVQAVGPIVVVGDPASVAQAVKRLESGAPPAVPDFAKPALSFPGACGARIQGRILSRRNAHRHGLPRRSARGPRLGRGHRPTTRLAAGCRRQQRTGLLT